MTFMDFRKMVNDFGDKHGVETPFTPNPFEVSKEDFGQLIYDLVERAIDTSNYELITRDIIRPYISFSNEGDLWIKGIRVRMKK